MKLWTKQLRVREWIKNGFIFLPVFFGGNLKDAHLIFSLCVGFFAFSFAASSIYCINDLIDVKEDRLHSIKQNRPYASGKLSAQQLKFASFFCFILAITLSFLLPVASQYILLLYFVIQLAYSFFLKRISVVDCVIIASGFVLRILFGGMMQGSPGSSWILLVTFLLSLYLAFAKRRCEMALGINNDSRKSLQYYSLQFLDTALAVTCAVTIVSYIMYTHDPEVINRIHFSYFYVSCVFVIVGMLRHLQQTIHQNGTESPTEYLLKDPIVLVTILMWLCFNTYILYR